MKTINATSMSSTLKTSVKCSTFILFSPSLSECRRSCWETQSSLNMVKLCIRTTTWKAIDQISNQTVIGLKKNKTFMVFSYKGTEVVCYSTQLSLKIHNCKCTHTIMLLTSHSDHLPGEKWWQAMCKQNQVRMETSSFHSRSSTRK